MIFLLFFLPVAVYLLVLAWINRQPRPVVVAGTWDFVGVLLAASGFLFFGGPAVLSTLHERWRRFWLFGEGYPAEGLDSLRQGWALLAALYFLAVIGGAGMVLWRRRAFTAVYNADPRAVEQALVSSCDQLGLNPIRSGDLYVFGLLLDGWTQPRQPRHPELQGPHGRSGRPGEPSAAMLSGSEAAADLDEELVGQRAILELDPFAPMSHVTLRWEPADSPLRRVVEGELRRRLTHVRAPAHEAATWLGLAGSALLLLSLLVCVALSLRAILVR